MIGFGVVWVNIVLLDITRVGDINVIPGICPSISFSGWVFVLILILVLFLVFQLLSSFRLRAFLVFSGVSCWVVCSSCGSVSLFFSWSVSDIELLIAIWVFAWSCFVHSSYIFVLLDFLNLSLAGLFVVYRNFCWFVYVVVVLCSFFCVCLICFWQI